MSWANLTADERALIADTLTDKQLDVYILDLAGCTDRQIADMLGYRSKGTVSEHLRQARNAIAALDKEHA